MRDDAWDAQQKANADRAKADSKKAYADSLDAGDDADAARKAADDADKHATDSETAASKAQTEADAATKSAEDADAAATRAEAAAKRARADSDAAQAAKADADAAVRTATATAADAIAASQHAAGEARAAVQLADVAEQDAKNAKDQAEAAKKDLAVALLAAAKSAGYAHVTAQAAVDAGKSAKQVVKPANDAIELGSPYVDNDSTAELVVLTGQASKTLADQQKTVADTHAKNAQAEADAAKNIADQAKDETKAALQSAANAARSAADARGYANQALDYSADAAKSAAAAVDSLNRTNEYDRQAGEDAAAADGAATRAEGYAKDARESADAAALDAQAAHKAADQASQDAKDARAAADRADKDATEAEQSAKDADKYAKETQETADRTEREKNAKRITDGAGSGIGSVFWIDRIEPIGKPEEIDRKNCGAFHTGDCVITAKVHFNVTRDYFVCTLPEVPETGCPSWESLLVDTQVVKDQYSTVTKTISMVEFNQGIDPIDVLFGDFIGCNEKLTGNGGSWGDCAWATLDIGSLFAGKGIKAIADAIKAVDASLRTGIEIEDAYRALKSLDGVNPGTLANISRTVEAYENDVRIACEAVTTPAPGLRSGSTAATRAGVAAASGPPCKFWKLTDFQGQRVYQRDDLINPDYVSPEDKYGRTNLKRMQQGLAPMGDGRLASGGKDKPMNLHHMLQTQDGPIAEVTDAMHFDNYGKLHWKSGTKIPSGIDRPEFEKWKKEYWKSRAKDFG
ncbi:HNH/ENDO VII family nuclease [Streptomyces sp. NPDC001250]|uniref:HNH/ENDO VII family nuclease n=1 Tax=Streptomyces sp. NPDC001250 TaxID=3154382 RepID=UPI003324C242